jgi:hypothetical protein
VIEWSAFPTVVGASLIAAGLIVTSFSLALRFGDGATPWRRIVSVSMFVVCGLVVLFGLYLIIPYFNK